MSYIYGADALPFLITGKTPVQISAAIMGKMRIFIRRFVLNLKRSLKATSERNWIENTRAVGFIYDVKEAERILKKYPAVHDSIMREAEKAISGYTDIPGFGERSIQFNGSADIWCEEPYAHRMLCRLDFLRPLVRAHILSPGRSDYASSIERLLIDWNNIHLTHRHWDSVDEAIRILILLETVSLVGNDLSNEAFLAGIKSIVRAAWSVEKNRTRTGNHLIYEGLALYFAGNCLHNYFRSSHWRKLGSEILEETMRLQVLNDGMNAELCTSYHLITGTNFIKAWVLAQKRDGSFSKEHIDRLRKMALQASRLQATDGGFFSLGDSDRMAGSSREENEARAFAQLGTFLQSPDDSQKPHDLEYEFLLADCDVSSLIDDKIADESASSEAGGYHIFSAQDGSKLIFDAGPFGLSGASHHGHADSLSFAVHLPDCRFLVDPGAFSYVDYRARSYARSTSAHNTVRIDGQNSSEVSGGFTFGRGADAELIEKKDLSFGVILTAEHDGYTRLSNPVIHRRSLIWLYEMPLCFIVIDHFEGTGKHLADLNFHGEIGWKVIAESNERIIWQFEDKSIIQSAHSNCPVQLDVLQGVKEPEWQGWVSPVLGQYKPAPVLVQKLEFKQPIDIVNIFCRVDQGDPELQIVQKDQHIELEGRFAVRWKWAGERLEVEMD
ncbi:hypothetical protein CEE37_03015 [candidate division LCP-89 bacterium B3_LCP]|uniref:Uncharacterized protein n=1 Tax=candidate division LCP-89 bacterium B3_LCP TaxID=2012998 RepID=A0A532V2V1_UNCL8|nr:MAG: hypothetical protein CEE37_03015 [candidate division LCP-89 bacterium B3_LCP]